MAQKPHVPAQRPPGHILTFYSYKGGTGRSMTLANMAWLLAMAGRKVVIIDWDLEAPGLHRYFHPFLSDPQLSTSDGVIDFTVRFLEEASKVMPDDPDWYAQHADITPLVNSIDFEFPGGGLLDFIPAGRQVDAYAGWVNSFNWKHFYEKLGGWSVIDEMRRRLREDYDFILIDSRTGVSDTAGICTVQIPDSVVICFTLNYQSVNGASGAARSIVEQRAMRKLEPVRMFPVPMRVEGSEKLKRDAVTAYAQTRFLDLLSSVETSAGTREKYWDEVELPHIAFYAFEEQLAWFLDKPTQVTGVLPSVKRLTKYATGVDVLNLPGPDPDRRAEIVGAFSAAWSLEAAGPSQKARLPTTTFVTFNELDRDSARSWVAEFPNASDVVQAAELRSVPWAEAVRVAMQRCASMHVLIGAHGLSHRQQRELAIGFNYRLRLGRNFSIVPVRLPGSPPSERPTFIDERDEAGLAWPYPGLRAFGIEDAEVFHGRDAIVDRLVNQVRNAAFVVVSGPYGSGRTSAVLAGLVPRLLVQSAPNPTWKAALCSFSHDPLESLAGALVRVRQTALSDAELASEVRGVADALRQGSAAVTREIVTACLSTWPPADRLVVVADDVQDIEAPSINALRQMLADAPVTLVLIADGSPTLPPLTDQELRFAIEGPAADARLGLEPSLVDRLVADIAREQKEGGALALLQFCLRRLCDVRRASVLTLAAYESIGGAGNAVRDWMESQFHAIPQIPDRGWHVLSRLVWQPARLAWAPRTISADSLDPAWIDDAERLVEAGILRRQTSMGGGPVEYSWSNDILFRRWPQFMERLEREAGDFPIRLHIEERVLLWSRARTSRLESATPYLLRGSQLEMAKSFAKRQAASVTSIERDLIGHSTDVADEEDRRTRTREQFVRRLRLAGTAALIVAAAVAAYVLYPLSTDPVPTNNELQKLSADGAVITAASDWYGKFSVKAVNAESGKPVSGARIAWHTPGCGDVVVVTETGDDGISEAPNLCVLLQDGPHEQRAVLVSGATPKGVQSDRLTVMGEPAIFRFTFQRDRSPSK
jgi:MinD-like ATPase involved in chromosome partitioning or flagellar assembly